MRILIIGGGSRIAHHLMPKLSGHTVEVTTKETYDLSKLSNKYLGNYDCVVVCACDFKRGRPDEEQKKCWTTNVTGIKNALTNTTYDRVIFTSSYLSGQPHAYGQQKKAVEDWIKELPERYLILRIDPIKDKKDYNIVADEIVRGLYYNESRCCNLSLQ